MRCRRSAVRILSTATLGILATTSARGQPSGTTLVYPPWSHCYGLHRVNQTHLTLRAGFRAQFDDPEGLAAVKLACEDDPKTPHDDDELTVFGVNSGQNMIIYNTSLTAIAFYGKAGHGIGEFRHPCGIAVDREGTVVVADTGNDRLHVLHYAEDRLTHGRFIDGSFNGRLLRGPTGVALEAGELYVCDPGENRVLVLDLEGHLRRELRPVLDGQPLLQEPFSVAVIRTNSDNNYFGENFVAVTDSSLSRLWRLDPQTGAVQAVRRCREVTSGGSAEFRFVAIDYYANVYCSDRGGHLHKFDRDLHYLLSIGRAGRGEYEFDEPRGMGLYRRFGQLFVAEREGAQYLWIGTDVFTPSVTALVPAGDDVQGTLRFFLTEYAQVALDVVDAKGMVVVALQPSTWMAPGAVTRPIRFVPPAASGPVRIRVVAVPTYSARKVLRVEKTTAPLVFNRASEAR